MQFSARNQLKGKIVEVKKGATTAHVRIDIGGGKIITASITNEFGRRTGAQPRQGRLRHRQGEQCDGWGGLARAVIARACGQSSIHGVFSDYWIVRFRGR